VNLRYLTVWLGFAAWNIWVYESGSREKYATNSIIYTVRKVVLENSYQKHTAALFAEK